MPEKDRIGETMPLTPLDPDIVKDLLSIYLAGEASPATRALVEQHLAADPELARLAAEARSEESPFPETARTPTPPPSAEKSALDTTRRALGRRSWLLAGALFATLVPFSFEASSEGIRFFLLTPGTAAICFPAAVALWIGYWRARRRLSVTGL
jgi:anti-sigma factor RsiW